VLPARSLGARGERFAASFLKRSRYRILGRNIRNKIGEIDLLALAPDRKTIVVVEVKSRFVRTGGSDPPPEASVTAAKQRKLIMLTRSLRRERGWEDRPVRIDVIAVEFRERTKPVVRHIENAVADR